MLIPFIEWVVVGFEAAGVLVLLTGFTLATVRFLAQPSRFDSHAAYIDYRHRMGRSLLLGLDFLIAGDIIKTIIVPEGLTSIAVLAAIVLIRTFLSMTLHLEVEGRWPWQGAAGKDTQRHDSGKP
ncbi:MAG: DUF1622 domain-containing protein [Ectothiorhodospiraceae bacterium]|nr:DUF1622 domain-containing protein [Ectothiorhodospiraceae bacterium]